MKNLEAVLAPINQVMIANNSAAGKTPPPIDQWALQAQAHCGEINIYIDARGKWFHEGDPINRQSLVKLFASILWHDNSAGVSQYFLITPAERLQIKVEDTPFVAVLSDALDSQWQVSTNLDETVVIGKQHPVELRMYQGQWLPYVCIRYDLWARVSRAVYEQWINAALDKQGEDHQAVSVTLTLASGDYLFKVASA
ncbi:MAG: hypothetical protein ACI80S_001929 [Pseudohongiellaceae bacterium]